MSETSPTSVPRRRGDELLSMLADRIGARLGASTVYGAPVERDGVTVVPGPDQRTSRLPAVRRPELERRRVRRVWLTR